MAKKEALHIILILDETGSMQDLKQETVSGLNAYIDSLKKESAFKKATLSRTSFNSLRIITDGKPLLVKDTPHLALEDYKPAGMTPLYDAIGKTIHEAEAYLASKSALVVIITDGEENCSQEYSREGIKTLIAEKEAAGWGFVYLGVGFDAFQASSAVGISSHNTQRVSASAAGVAEAYGYASKASLRYASQGGSRNLLDNGD